MDLRDEFLVLRPDGPQSPYRPQSPVLVFVPNILFS